MVIWCEWPDNSVEAEKADRLLPYCVVSSQSEAAGPPAQAACIFSRISMLADSGILLTMISGKMALASASMRHSESIKAAGKM